jgi:hypothetical protein
MTRLPSDVSGAALRRALERAGYHAAAERQPHGGNRDTCDDGTSGLTGIVIGAPIGAAVGAILGYQLTKQADARGHVPSEVMANPP